MQVVVANGTGVVTRDCGQRQVADRNVSSIGYVGTVVCCRAQIVQRQAVSIDETTDSVVAADEGGIGRAIVDLGDVTGGSQRHCGCHNRDLIAGALCGQARQLVVGGQAAVGAIAQRDVGNEVAAVIGHMAAVRGGSAVGQCFISDQATNGDIGHGRAAAIDLGVVQRHRLRCDIAG